MKWLTDKFTIMMFSFVIALDSLALHEPILAGVWFILFLGNVYFYINEQRKTSE
jgi:hypothetical protein